MYTGRRLDYRLGLWAHTSASRAVSAVAEVLVIIVCFSKHIRKPIGVLWDELLPVTGAKQSTEI